ncbi:hypothetical protein [Modestobacter sp. URMC 112]
MSRRLVRLYVEADDDDGYVQFVNDLWARMPDGDWHLVLDSKASVDRANADYDARYRQGAPRWTIDDAAETEADAERLDAVAKGRSRSGS